MTTMCNSLSVVIHADTLRVILNNNSRLSGQKPKIIYIQKQLKDLVLQCHEDACWCFAEEV